MDWLLRPKDCKSKSVVVRHESSTRIIKHGDLECANGAAAANALLNNPGKILEKCAARRYTPHARSW